MTSLEVYSFASVQGDVFSRGANVAKRPYVPKGSCVHISITAARVPHTEPSLHEIGIPRRLKKGGDDDNDKNKSNNDNGKVRKERNDDDDDDFVPVALTGIIATDSAHGTCLTRRTAAGSDGDGGVTVWESAPIPSGQRIGCIQLSPASRTAILHCSPHAAAAFPSPVLYVADGVGNVYSATFPAASVVDVGAEAPAKRSRHEVNGENSFWNPIVPASTAEGNLTAGGARGWCGLLSLSSQQLLCCREFFFDLRLMDVSTGSIVQQYGTIQPPTGVTGCSGIPHAVVVAEGQVASLYDMRCPGSVLTLNNNSNNNNNNTNNNNKKGDVSLVTSRLTNPASCVADVCSTSNEYEVALAVGRSLCVHDVRKWTRLGVSTNILKYEIGSIASFAGGNAVVAAGIDAEVRLVSLRRNAVAPPTPHVSANEKGNAHKGAEVQKEQQPAAMSFRNRLNSAVCCRSTWNGGWVESLDGLSATGVSADHELFVSF